MSAARWLAAAWLALVIVIAPVPEFDRAFDALAGVESCCKSDCCCKGDAPCAPGAATRIQLVSGCCCGHHGGGPAHASAEPASVHVESAGIVPALRPRAALAIAPARHADELRWRPEPPPPRSAG